MADIDARELMDAAEDLRELHGKLEFRVPEVVREMTKELQSRIRDQIIAEGLVEEGEDTKPEQTDLFKSFKFSQVDQNTWRVISRAPHAWAHEEGSNKGGGYRIEPDEADLLAWEPENPDDYPTKKPGDFAPSGTWYDPEVGMVFSTGVNHPGVEASNYIFKAQKSWEIQLQRELNGTIKEAIVTSGFKPKG